MPVDDFEAILPFFPYLFVFLRTMQPLLPDHDTKSETFMDLSLTAAFSCSEERSGDEPYANKYADDIGLPLPKSDSVASTDFALLDNLLDTDDVWDDEKAVNVPDYNAPIPQGDNSLRDDDVDVSTLLTSDKIVDSKAAKFRQRLDQVLFFISCVIQLLRNHWDITEHDLELDCIIMPYIALGILHAEEKTIIDRTERFNELSVPWKKIKDIKLCYTHRFSKRHLHPKVTVAIRETFSRANVLKEMEALYDILVGSQAGLKTIQWTTIDQLHSHLMCETLAMPVQQYFDHQLLKIEKVVQEADRNQSPPFCAAVTKLYIETASFFKDKNLFVIPSCQLLRNKLSHLEGSAFGRCDQLGPYLPICMDFFNTLVINRKPYILAIQYIECFKDFPIEDQDSIILQARCGIEWAAIFKEYLAACEVVYNPKAFQLFLDSVRPDLIVLTHASMGYWKYLTDKLPRLMLTQQFSIDQQDDRKGNTILHYVLLAHTKLKDMNKKVVNVAGICFKHSASLHIINGDGQTAKAILQDMVDEKKFSLFKEICKLEGEFLKLENINQARALRQYVELLIPDDINKPMHGNKNALDIALENRARETQIYLEENGAVALRRIDRNNGRIVI